MAQKAGVEMLWLEKSPGVLTSQPSPGQLEPNDSTLLFLRLKFLHSQVIVRGSNPVNVCRMNESMLSKIP